MKPDKNISILFKGPNGFGKTLAAASFAAAGPIYLAYFDKRQPIELLSYFSRIGRRDILDNIEYEVFSSHNPQEYLNRLKRFANDCRYMAVITDSVTNLTSSAVNWSMAFRNGGRTEGKDPALIPDFDDYKVETSLVSQALDITKILPCFNIWIAHPLPKLEITGTGRSMTVTKTTSIVSYGQKVGAMVPGAFTEIYQFARKNSYSFEGAKADYVVLTDQLGDDYAKTALGLPAEINITDKLFYEVWSPLAMRAIEDLTKEKDNDVTDAISSGMVSRPETKW